MHKFSVGHTAYPSNNANAFEPVHNIFGIYASLWERGATPQQCAFAVARMQAGVPGCTITLARSQQVIEVNRNDTTRR